MASYSIIQVNTLYKIQLVWLKKSDEWVNKPVKNSHLISLKKTYSYVNIVIICEKKEEVIGLGQQNVIYYNFKFSYLQTIAYNSKDKYIIPPLQYNRSLECRYLELGRELDPIIDAALSTQPPLHLPKHTYTFYITKTKYKINQNRICKHKT